MSLAKPHLPGEEPVSPRRRAADLALAMREGRTLGAEERAFLADFIDGALAEGLEPERAQVPCLACAGTGRNGMASVLGPGDARDAGLRCGTCHGTGHAPTFWPRLVRDWTLDEAFERPVRSLPPQPSRLVRVRSHGKRGRDASDLGMLVGQAALTASVSVDASGHLAVTPEVHTPLIYLFASGRVVYGTESRWESVRAPAQTHQAADDSAAWESDVIAALG